jgi:16S rRNA (cytosine1402-N4)-methyltransferase
MPPPTHIPVLLTEVMTLLAPRPGETAVDCTAGLGGHSAALAEAVGPSGRVVAFDLDPANLARAEQRLAATDCPFTGCHRSFGEAPDALAAMDVRADVVLADLGFSSSQMDDPQRGMSFRADGPLDMRYDPGATITAAQLLATLDEADLADLIHELGEEPMARKIARKVALTRRSEPIQSSAQLARLVRQAYGPRARSSRMNPATRTFMALRIAVNDELTALDALLDHVVRGSETANDGGWLRKGARVAVISFHSLEDRRVKRAFAELARRGLATRLTKRPVTAGDQEVAANPRARSAKLRAVRILGPHANQATAGEETRGR